MVFTWYFTSILLRTCSYHFDLFASPPTYLQEHEKRPSPLGDSLANSVIKTELLNNNQVTALVSAILKDGEIVCTGGYILKVDLSRTDRQFTGAYLLTSH